MKILSVVLMIFLFCSSALASNSVMIGELNFNEKATIIGKVTGIVDEDEFIITDETGSILVYTQGRYNLVNLGDDVVIEGQVDNDELEFYANLINIL